MRQTWYAAEGSKLAEFWTVLHLPYTIMCISFVLIGMGIEPVKRFDVVVYTSIAYFLGLTASHAFDQLEGMGSHYVKHLTQKELILLGIFTVSFAVLIGIYLMIELGAYGLLWIIPLQTFFVWAYPNSKFMGGIFHNDTSFVISWGFIPVMAGYYINTLNLNAEFIPWAVVATLISGIEITLSRYVRKWRKNVYLLQEPSIIDKPERALILLCFLSYLLALIMLVKGGI